MNTHIYTCPACCYNSTSFASVAMHFIRCHHRVVRNGYGEKVNKRLAAKLRVLEQRFRRYREAHP